MRHTAQDRIEPAPYWQITANGFADESGESGESGETGESGESGESSAALIHPVRSKMI